MSKTFKFNSVFAAVVGFCTLCGQAWGQSSTTSNPPTLGTVTVESSRNSVLGEAGTANEGVVTQKQLDARTVYRPGEVLEAVPGLIVSQHSGEGKANQFYLRGRSRHRLAHHH